MKKAVGLQSEASILNDSDFPVETPYDLFDFLNTEKYEDCFIEVLSGLLPDTQGEDYEEQDSAKMKKKRKRRGRQ